VCCACTLSLTDAVGVARDVVLTVCGIATAFAAVRGLQAWREQLLGTERHSVSRALLKSCYGLRDAIRTARSPYMQIPVENQLSALRATPAEMLDLEERHYMDQLRVVETAADAVRAAAVEARAVFGEEVVSGLVSPILTLASDLRLDATEYFQARRDQIEQDTPETDGTRAQRRRVFDVLSREPNEIASKLRAEIGRIEGELLRH